MDPDAFIVAFRSSELDLAGEVDAVDDVLEGLGGGGELMLLVIVQRHGDRPYSPTMSEETGRTVCSSRMTAVQMRLTAMATP